MNWDDARVFLAAAREGQMLGAARRLAVSQAMLSRRVAALEEATGTRLLHRSTRGCTLTTEGRILFETAERMEAEMLAALAEVQGRSGVSGTIRIGAPDGFGSAFLAPRLQQIIQAYPDLHLQLVPVPRSFSLSQREADVAVMIGQPAKGRLRTRRLTDYTLGLYASRSYISRRGMPQTPDDLRTHQLVGYVEDLIYTAELTYAREILPDWRSAVEVATAVGQLAAVRAGAGIAVLHDFMAADCAELVPVLPHLHMTRTYWTAWHETLRGARGVQAVLTSLTTMVRDEGNLFIRPRTQDSR
ncbi:LysR family transcriptional regulator [Falsirhodobacter deserti]|uniref:LysR family transcriptional regulator n=1 Tax=Falsirhodobacter deserti TaxID=1365611 RepID=UPI000FE33720|nr:LysR family transcriptional regulator [Falsirhodobacter deserti]